MFKIGANNSISLTRGDTLKAVISLTKDNAIYTPDSTDIITFSVKFNINDTSCALTKTIPSDTLLLELNPSDTALLDFKEYHYDISIKKQNGEKYTFITDSPFILTAEIG